MVVRRGAVVLSPLLLLSLLLSKVLWKQSHCCRGISRLNFSVGSYLGIQSFENDIVVLSFGFIFSIVLLLLLRDGEQESGG